MSSDLTTPLLDKNQNANSFTLSHGHLANTLKRPNALGLFCAFIANVFMYLAVAILKYLYTLYPFLKPLDV